MAKLDFVTGRKRERQGCQAFPIIHAAEKNDTWSLHYLLSGKHKAQRKGIHDLVGDIPKVKCGETCLQFSIKSIINNQLQILREYISSNTMTHAFESLTTAQSYLHWPMCPVMYFSIHTVTVSLNEMPTFIAMSVLFTFYVTAHTSHSSMSSWPSTTKFWSEITNPSYWNLRDFVLATISGSKVTGLLFSSDTSMNERLSSPSTPLADDEAKGKVLSRLKNCLKLLNRSLFASLT